MNGILEFLPSQEAQLVDYSQGHDWTVTIRPRFSQNLCKFHLRK